MFLIANYTRLSVTCNNLKLAKLTKRFTTPSKGNSLRLYFKRSLNIHLLTFSLENHQLRNITFQPHRNMRCTQIKSNCASI